MGIKTVRRASQYGEQRRMLLAVAYAPMHQPIQYAPLLLNRIVDAARSNFYGCSHRTRFQCKLLVFYCK